MHEAVRITPLMGTTITTKIWHEDPEPILDQVESLLYLYKDRFSANDAQSELMQVNREAGLAPVQVAPDLFELIQLGKEHSCAKPSQLNITIGPLVQLWRIGFSDARKPSQEEIDERLALVDPRKIQLDEEQQTVFLPQHGMKIDLGALAKGYIADRVVDHLKRVGVHKGMVNLGGNVLTFGVADHQVDGLWKIGIQNPSRPRGEHLAIVPIEEGSVVTSGIYERTLQVDGHTYHHILDSQTGYPVDSLLASLTIVSKESVMGEVWTTRLFGLPLDVAFQLAVKEPGIEALFVTREGEVFGTPGLSYQAVSPQGDYPDAHSVVGELSHPEEQDAGSGATE